MTNLYPRDAFPSADYMLSFHIGLTARITHRSQRNASGPTPRVAGAYRRWEQAARALDDVKESEDLHAVGVKCRQCLLTFIREAQGGVELPPDAARPKGADFPAWADLIANWAPPGGSAEDLRAYVKSSAKITWQIANWLTHTPNARHVDAELTVESLRHLLDAYVASIVRRESNQPDRCPKCSSFHMLSLYTPELDRDPPYVLMCEVADGMTRMHRLSPACCPRTDFLHKRTRNAANGSGWSDALCG